MRKPTTLMAGKLRSRHFGTKPFLADALRLTGKEAPLVLYIGAASGDDRLFGSALSSVLEAEVAGRVLWPKLTGRRSAASHSQACRRAPSCSASDGYAGRARTRATRRPRPTSAWASRPSRSIRTGKATETITPLMLDDAIHAALGPDATIEQWQLAADTLLVVDGARARSSAASAAAAAEAVGTLLARAVRGERVSAIAPEASDRYRLVKH